MNAHSLIGRRPLMRWSSVLVLALAGCAQHHSDLQNWMRQKEASMHPFVKPLPKPVDFKPKSYDDSHVVEPFSYDKTAVTVAQQSTVVPRELQEWLNHAPEPLEAFPLDQLTMVGTLKDKTHGRLALVRVGHMIYTVHPGEYVGQSHGRVESIGSASIHVVELVQDATGDWIKRPQDITLQAAPSA